MAKDTRVLEKKKAILQDMSDNKIESYVGNSLLNVLTYGSNTPEMVDQTLKRLQASMNSIRERETEMEKTRMTANRFISEKRNEELRNVNILKSQIETNSEIASDYDALFLAKKRHFSALSDFEIMPMLVPEVSRVLSFLVEECISPDIQNDKNFIMDIRQSSDSTKLDLYSEMDEIRKANKLDTILHNIYDKRSKVGFVYYKVTTFKNTVEKILSSTNLTMNESVSDLLMKFPDSANGSISLNEAFGISLDNRSSADITKKFDIASPNVEFEIQFGDNNDVKALIESYHIERQLYSKCNSIFNEAASDDTIANMLKVIKNQSESDINSCYIESMDPKKVFAFEVSGRVVGYIYQKTTGSSRSSINYMQYVKDTLKNSAMKELSEIELKNRVIKKFGDSLLKEVNIDKKYLKSEDIDLLHDFLINSVNFGEKSRYVFYTKEEVFNFSRNGGSLLTNAVYHAKLLASLKHNNIMTKILRGRSKFIHTVNIGIGDDVGIYVENAIEALTRPEARLGDMTGPFESIVNSHQAASDIVIPSPSGEQTRYITTDIIDGVNVDMDSDISKTLTNGIIMSMNVNPAVLDLTSNQIDFARTISMISKETANFVKVEQNEVFSEFPRFIKKILSAGSKELQESIENGEIVIKAYKPSSIALAMKNDEINAAKTFVDTIIDAIPNLPDDEVFRKIVSYKILQSILNIDFGEYERIINDSEMLYPEIILRLKKSKLVVDSANSEDGDKTGTE